MDKVLLSLFLLLLASCKLGPDYRRPYVDTPEGFYFETKDAKDSLNLEWWNQFDDPVLEDLIAEALENNKNIKIAAANIMNAVGIVIQTRAQLFPQVGYSGTYSRTRTSTTLAPAIPLPFVFPNPQTAWQAVLNAVWDIDFWGRVRRLTEAAEANVYATYQARQNVILSLVASVANAYIQLLGLDEQLAISIRTMQAYEDEVKYFEAQFKYGQESLMTVAQAKTQYETAAAQIPAIKTQIIQTESALNVLLARNPGPIKRGKNIYQLNLPDVPADLPSELLEQRPDIMEAEGNLIAANAQIGAAIALYFPSISLTGYYGGASAHLKNLFAGPSNTWNFTGSITGPIFTAGAIYGQVVQAEAQQQAALVAYQETIQNAFSDVENALSAHEYLQEQLVAQERLVEAAGEYQDLSILQFKGGYAPYFIVIQAEEQYFPAQLALVKTRAQLYSSLVDIYQAMGGGWVNLAEAMTYPPTCDE
jgi:multidrug efflux system outer membrane protein